MSAIAGAWPFREGLEISEPLCLSDADVRAGADFFRDANPLHRDPGAARAAGFPALLASGQHSGGLHACMLASYPASLGFGVLGLDYSARYRRPVYAGRAYRMTWRVQDVQPRGPDWEVSWSGQIVDAHNDEPALQTTGRILLRRPAGA